MRWELLPRLWTARPNVSSDVAAEVSDIFEDVNYSLGQLVSLSSELREAYPLDLDVRSNASSAAARGASTDGSPRDFIEMAKRLFPGSSPVLTERLGRASWKRHLSMRLLRDKKSAAIATRLETYKLGPKRAPRYDVAVDAFNFQQPALRKGSVPSPPSIPRIEKTSSDLSRPEGSESEDEEDGEPLTSMQSSVFSRPLTSRATSHTSYAPSLAQLSYAPVSRKERELDVLSVSPPPRALDGQPFLCPYCGFDLNLDKRIDTVDRWEEHVFEDLFAYLCTFDDCNWPRKTYGARHEWHLHELRNHIVPRVWSCAVGALLRELKSKHFIQEQKPQRQAKVHRSSVNGSRGRRSWTPEPHKWSRFKEYLPHVANLQRIYSDQNTVVTLRPFLEMAELFKDGGVLLWQRFLRTDAMRLLTTAEKVLDQLDTGHDDLRAEIHITMNLPLLRFRQLLTPSTPARSRWQIRNALHKAEGKPGKSVWPDAAVARSKFHLSQILRAKQGGQVSGEGLKLAEEGKDVLSRLLVYDDIQGVTEEDTGALFDHLQPVFGGRWTGERLLKYVS
ncbi:hypothetical protein C8034_v004996 [Colletotrichum sidae]|uniref:Oxidoreductase acuF-like C2H2 type zinc-finger domain-containing protein n=1 Tax=Colletotrichum sidae TaxID=1347389 RepID=A0A4V3I271_9PEZI|nr:hypothetical protein C8034_v004996 [Colletotrichum sidae]